MASPLLSVLDRFAPGKAADAVARAFCAIPKPPPLPDRQRTLHHGEAFEVDVAGRRIHGELWGGGRHIHLAHGWGAWHQQLAAHVTPLVEHGHQVLAHDALGHGESDAGPHGAGSGTVLDLAASLTAVAAAHGPVAGVVAHSAGAMAALHAVQQGLAVERLALIAPSPSLTSTLTGLGKHLGISARTMELVPQRLAAMVDQDPATFEFIGLGARLTNPPPLLVVHDVDDPEAPIADARDLVAQWPGARLVETSGYRHRRVIWAPETVAAVSEFFA